MNKSLIAIASATFALATFANSSAEAGFHFGGHHGLIGAVLSHSFHHCHRPEYIVRTPVERVYVSRPARQVAVTNDEEPATKVAAVHNENSTIAVASADVTNNEPTDSVEKIIVTSDKTAAADAKPAKVAEATVETGSQTGKRLDCKKFFPSVGMTVTVPCE